MSKRKVLIARKLSPSKFRTQVKSGRDLSDPIVRGDRLKQILGQYYGWKKGLVQAGFEVETFYPYSHILPTFLLSLLPNLYIKIGYISELPPFKYLNLFLFKLHFVFKILAFQPKIIIFPYDQLPQFILPYLRRQNIETVCYFEGPPYHNSNPRERHRVLNYDHIISGFDLPKLWSESEDKFRRIIVGPSIQNEFLHEYGFDENIDVMIYGGFGEMFRERTRIVSEILDEYDNSQIEISVFGYERGLISSANQNVKNNLNCPLTSKYFAMKLNQSKIVLTIPNDPHIEIDSSRPLGVVEAAAAGRCQVALNTKETADMFEPGEEIVLFDHVEELKERIEYYVRNDSERLEIGEKSRKKYLNSFTAEAQIQDLFIKLELLSVKRN